MRLIPTFLLLSLVFVCGIAMADQVVPFSPPANVTGNYTYHQGNDYWSVNTNFPLSSQDVVYPEALYYLIVTIGFAFLAISAVFIARSDTVPSIAIMMCGLISMGMGYAAAEMAPLVGYSQVFQTVVPSAATSGVYVVNATSTIYVNHIIVYTMGVFAGYAGIGEGVAGFVVFAGGVLSLLGYLHRRGVNNAAKGKYVEMDIEDDGGESGNTLNPYKKGINR